MGAMAPAHAAYPDRPIRMIVPSTPGGGTDLAARMVMPKLSEFLGQQIVIDNRGGASGNIGAELGARAAPDGYTLTAAVASLTSNSISISIVNPFSAITRLVELYNYVSNEMELV